MRHKIVNRFLTRRKVRLGFKFKGLNKNETTCKMDFYCSASSAKGIGIEFLLLNFIRLLCSFIGHGLCYYSRNLYDVILLILCNCFFFASRYPGFISSWYLHLYRDNLHITLKICWIKEVEEARVNFPTMLLWCTTW